MTQTPPAIGGQTGIASGLGRAATGDNLKRAGQQFEAVFTGMMLKSMRQAKLADPLFDDKASNTFRDMQDANVAKAMAEHQPLGIGKAMTEFLERTHGVPDAPPAATPEPPQATPEPPQATP